MKIHRCVRQARSHAPGSHIVAGTDIDHAIGYRSNGRDSTVNITSLEFHEQWLMFGFSQRAIYHRLAIYYEPPPSVQVQQSDRDDAVFPLFGVRLPHA